LNYIKKIVANRRVESLKHFDQLKERIYFKKLILASSDNMASNCLKCGMEACNEMQCGDCKRFIHKKCFYNEEVPDSGSFDCKLFRASTEKK
jgi:hypothetical protein